MSQENNFVPNQQDYKPLSPFHLFVKSNFPFIENTYEALDNYGLYCKIVEYLNTVIENENTVEDNVSALYNAFTSLNAYVSNYFDNLNVQQEINNKLDEMAETGELENIIRDYFEPLKDELDLKTYSQDNKIDSIQRQVNSLTTSINPIPVSDISDMTNTSRIYVLLTNGNWYYYNGVSWVSGGVYQAQVTDDAVSELQNTKVSKTVVKNLYNPTTSVNGYINTSTGNITSSNDYKTSDFIYLKENDVLKLDSPCRFIALYNTSKVFQNMIISSNTYGYTYTATANCYIRISFANYISDNAIVYKNNSKDTLEYIPLNIEENVKLNGMQKAQIEQILQNITGYEDTSITLTFIEDHLYNWQTNELAENNNNDYCVINVNAGDVYVIDGYSYHSTILATIVNENAQRFLIPSTGYTTDVVHTQDYEFIVPFTGKLYINRIGNRAVSLKKRTSVIRNIGDLVNLLDSNCLYNKKIAFLGDSFTHGDYRESPTDDYYITEGIYTGQYKVYPYLIGNRNNMEVDNLAVNGMTLAQYEDASNVLSKDGGAYTQIDNDTDYIIIKIGINDDVSHHNIPIGNISDTSNTTFYGAFNKVMNYLIEHYPNAKIGIIASNGISTTDYIDATLNIAEKFGVKCLNESTDYNVPLLIRTLKTKVSSAIRNLRNQQWYVNTSQETPNFHPNAKAHEYESYIVEDFIKSL